MQTKTLPGAPAGDYQVLQFQTRFASKPDAIETVVLAREQKDCGETFLHSDEDHYVQWVWPSR